MKRKIALAALLSMLAVSGLAIGGDSGALATNCCDPSWCPESCQPCPVPCDDDCTVDAASMSACSVSE
ncbi:MAG: hypothetical protein ABIS67_08735 [Candidatus Eisenbacteria bacterium]